VHIRQSSPIFEDCWFVQNYGWGGASAIEYSPSEPVFRRCLFVGNGQWSEVPTPNGGAIFLYYGAHPVFEDCSFYGNAGVGSTLFVYGSTACHADFNRCIIAFGDDDSESIYAGGPVNCGDVAGCSIDLTCCNVFGNSAGDYIDCIAGQSGVNGNLSADPLFYDTAVGDLYLLAGSPCAPSNNSCNARIGALGIGSFNTPAGDSLEVTHANVTVRFDTVELSGQTEVEADTAGPTTPASYTTVPGDPRRYYEIQTSALYGGPVTVCIGYDDSEVIGDEADLKLLHWYDGLWDDITASHDTVANVLCGLSESLSPFILSQPEDPLAVTEPGGKLPLAFALSQNYPNPFNPSTTISYSLPSRSQVRLEVLNILGQTVVTLIDAEQSAGVYEAVWDGTDGAGQTVASGVYLYRLRAAEETRIRKMLLLK
jgi:hypothetical protein